jgi:hypothetical protein
VSVAIHRPSHRWSAVVGAAVVAGGLCCQSGCVATKYKLAKKDTPPVQPLNVPFEPSGPLQTTLTALIIYSGPGSWKREALWDEYIVTTVNHSERPLIVDAAMLIDSSGTTYESGNDSWALEKQSKQMEKQYRDHGEAFVRAAGPGVLIVGAGAAVVSATTASVYFSAAAAGAAMATIVVLPVYYVTVLGINHHNKEAVVAEFTRRRLPLPFTLAPGETRIGSVFYPMVRDPRSLELHWSSESGGGQAALPLNFLHGLHVPAASAEQLTLH